MKRYYAVKSGGVTRFISISNNSAYQELTENAKYKVEEDSMGEKVYTEEEVRGIVLRGRAETGKR